MKKLNCWEFHKCGREKGGIHADRLGVCLNAVLNPLDGVNSGHNGGRYCWGIAGNQNINEGKSAVIDNYKVCSECPFYNLVEKEEIDTFIS